MSYETPELKRMNRPLAEVDPDIAEVLREEGRRQGTGLELIPSENFVSEAVLEAMGSVLTNKYAEGYPGKRYYGGCEFVDVAEQLAIDRAKKLFGAEHANVQPHSGTQANISVYMTALQPGDTVLGMNLAHGGHLTHGHPLNFSGKTVQVHPLRRAQGHRADRLRRNRAPGRGTQAEDDRRRSQRLFAHHRLRRAWREIAASVGAVLFVDMAHIAGLVAAGVHPSPVPHADFVFHHHAQDAARPARRPGPVQAEMRQGTRPHHLPRHAGRPADAHHRGQGRLPEGSRSSPSFASISKQVAANAKALAAEIAKPRLPHRQRRHGQSSVPGGPVLARHHRQGSAERRWTAPASPSTRIRFPSIPRRR